jgi:hypothetical protein
MVMVADKRLEVAPLRQAVLVITEFAGLIGFSERFAFKVKNC